MINELQKEIGILNKLDRSQNNISYIEIRLHNKKYINLYIFEKLLCFLKQKQNIEGVIYKYYYKYKYKNNILHINANGSSSSYYEKYTHNILLENISNNIPLDCVCVNLINKKMNNDCFQSQYEYDSILKIESLFFIYNNIHIEMAIVNNKHKIYIHLKDKISSNKIFDLINIISNLV